ELDGVEKGAPLLPFAWSGVSLHASWATSLRVRIAPTGEQAVSVAALDETGRPVLAVEELAQRRIDGSQLEAARGASGGDLYRVEWVDLPVASTNGAAQRVAAMGGGIE